MMTDEKIAEINGLVQRGDVRAARDELAALLAAQPDDDVARMLFGTCAQLLGDEDTFGRIRAELEPRMASAEAAGEQSARTTLWARYKALAAKLAMPCMAVASSVILCGCYGCPPSREYEWKDGERPVSLQNGPASEGRRAEESADAEKKPESDAEKDEKSEADGPGK